MKDIRLLKLILKDFQGGNFTLLANGKDVNCYGANASGKTRLLTAFSWVLFSKDALGRSEFAVKNLDAQGEPEHNLQHSVEMVLDIEGEPITLKKTLAEVWQKKRGASQNTFTGHTNEFHINGVPIQKKLFDEKIIEITGSEETFKLLTSPTVFPALPWQRQRTILLDVVGDMSDQDVIASDLKLSSLPGLLGKHSLDDHRKIVMARRSEINKEMERIPIRIDEVRRGLPDVTGVLWPSDRGKAEKAVQHFDRFLIEAKLRLQGENTGGRIADLTKKLSGLNADLRKMEDAHRSGSLATLNRLNQEISEVEASINASRRRATAIDGDLKQKEGQLPRIDSDLSRLRGQWIAVDAEEMKDDPTDEYCLACGRALPPEQIKTAKENYFASFNSSKAERLGEINRNGKDLKGQRDRLQGEIDALKQDLLILEERLPANEAEVKHIIEARDSIKRNSEDFSGIQGRAELWDKVSEIEGQIKAEREGKTEDIEKIKAEVRALQVEYASASDTLSKFTTREQGEKRIGELKVEEKKLASEFEKLEGELYLMDQFIRAKVGMLTDRINAKFETVRFKLFDVQINGAVAECCTITVNGVPFDSGLNNGARINAGLEIVKVLQQHYGIKAPVFADNAEAVNSLVEVGCQMIRLYVSEDKELRIEVSEKERMTA